MSKPDPTIRWCKDEAPLCLLTNRRQRITCATRLQVTCIAEEHINNPETTT